MPHRQVKYYQIVLIAAAVALLVWQFLIVNDIKTTEASASGDALSFLTNTGVQVTIPGSLDDRLAVVVFWGASSARSSQQVNEAMSLFKEPGVDTLATLFLVNYGDSLAAIRSAVDFDNPDLPFARSPQGSFFNSHPIRSLPVTAVFNGDGQLLGMSEGYQEGQLKDLLTHAQMLRELANRPGGVKLPFGGRTVK